MGETPLMGAVAYDPKVVTIWEGFRRWLRSEGLPFDFVLYSHYERQVEDLVDGRIHAAWNSPLAALRAERVAAARGRSVRATVMRHRPGPDVGGGRSRGFRHPLARRPLGPDFSLASFLLSVLGEGSFLALLAFLDQHAPDPVTRQVTRLARVDEARHVAFGVAHLERQAELDPALRGKLRAAIERRHDALVDTAGLNADVFDALIVLAAGGWEPAAIARGHRAVEELGRAMDDGRRQRLARLGFPPDEAAELSALHTRNFM